MKARPPAVFEGELGAHPAVAAWRRPGADRPMPEALYVLRERRQSGVYRLPGVGVDGADVFAKRSRTIRHEIERTVYEEILTRLPVSSARYYGSWAEEAHGWIFVEDLGSERYSESDSGHLRLGARWIATVHVHGQNIPAVRSLPGAGPSRYLEHLHLGRERIGRGLEAWTFPAEDVQMMQAGMTLCDRIERRWEQVEALCAGAPSTLVHGDFQPKNVFVDTGGQITELHVIDWEMAGFGSPAADLTRIDLPTYWAEVHDAWPGLTWETVERLAVGGQVLQALAELDWASSRLELDSAAIRSVAVAKLEPAVRRLTRLASTAGIFQA